jgi:CheY-like chemotaxis protein
VVCLEPLAARRADGLQAGHRHASESGCRAAARPSWQALTASTSDEEKQRSVDAGMVAHLSKPIKEAQQLGVLHELVAASRRKQAPATRMPRTPRERCAAQRTGAE